MKSMEIEDHEDEGLVMVKGDHKGDDTYFFAQTQTLQNSNKLLHIPPKLWPPIISKH
jgi:hypothetical protein